MTDANVDMGKLRDAMGRAEEPKAPPPPEVSRFAPPRVREAAQAPAGQGGPKKITPLQTIGEFVTRLTWREAETMGKGIAAKMKGQTSEEVAKTLTAAIQEWAWEHETFEAEVKPGGETA